MKWPWSKPTPPAIPPYPVVVHPQTPPEPSIIVDEIDTSAMTRTGVMRAWDRLTGKFKDVP